MDTQPDSHENTLSTPDKQSSLYTIGITYRLAGKIYTYLCHSDKYTIGMQVIVKNDKAEVIANVITAPKKCDSNINKEKYRYVLRQASEDDINRHHALREQALSYSDTCQKKINDHHLDMKLIDAEITENGKKAIFFFFSEERVDFRQLVKDLASHLRIRIEMRQVGARDEAKIVGAMGPCGKVTCCSQHLRQFQSISISLAKQQGLAPNPSKLTGMCGKLKCCLAYEADAYNEMRKGLPKLGSAVQSPKGPGKVVDINILKQECGVQLYGSNTTRCACAECHTLKVEERDQILNELREKNQKQAADRAENANKKMHRRSNRKNNAKSNVANKNNQKRNSRKNGPQSKNKK